MRWKYRDNCFGHLQMFKSTVVTPSLYPAAFKSAREYALQVATAKKFAWFDDRILY